MKRSGIIFIHAAYWFILLLLLFSLFSLLMAALIPGFQQQTGAYWIMRWLMILLPFVLLPGVLSFYFSYTVLFKKFLRQKKIVGLGIAVVLTGILCGAIGEAVISLYEGKLFPGNDPIESLVVVAIISMIALLNGIMGLVLKGFITWYEEIRLKEDLNKRNYEMELALVKSQIDPHFLFNTISNIDVLIEMDSKRASDYLNKLSDIMRFMLYETKYEKIPLEKEISYIEKYIALQKIRSLNADNIRFSVEGIMDQVWIEPMVFIPFIENAFKFSEKKKPGNEVDVHIVINRDQIRFDCKNTYVEREEYAQTEYSGLGNDLIQKRLALLYPQKHQLSINKANGIYHVSLTIDLT